LRGVAHRQRSTGAAARIGRSISTIGSVARCIEFDDVFVLVEPFDLCITRSRINQRRSSSPTFGALSQRLDASLALREQLHHLKPMALAASAFATTSVTYADA